VSRATSVSWPEAEELLWRTVRVVRRLGVFALRLRALASLPLALERRRMAYPKAQDYADFQSGITAPICDLRNGVKGHVCRAAILRCSRPLWVKSRHRIGASRCPLYPRKRTLLSASWMSASQ